MRWRRRTKRARLSAIAGLREKNAVTRSNCLEESYAQDLSRKLSLRRREI